MAVGGTDVVKSEPTTRFFADVDLSWQGKREIEADVSPTSEATFGIVRRISPLASLYSGSQRWPESFVATLVVSLVVIFYVVAVP